MMSIQSHIDMVKNQINAAAKAAGRDPQSVRLVAVGKTFPADRLRAATEAGLTIFGENYIQEARKKFDALGDLAVDWHFIGHLQSNKAKYAVRMFDLIHSVDSVKLAREISKQAAKIDKIQAVLAQVNISRETSKSGVSETATEALLRQIAPLSHVAVKGLMTMPPFFNDPEGARPCFKALRMLRDRIREKRIPNIALDELSMGMTGDFQTAIAEGATLVRVGTAIFGGRT